MPALLLALAGLVAVAVALVATTADLGSPFGTDKPDRPAISVTKSHASYVLYLVGSQAQADEVQRGLDEASMERYMNGVPEPNTISVIYTATTEADAANANELIDMWLASEPESVRTFDLR
jgi:hypothetical protein